MKMKKKGFKAGGMKKKGYAMGKMVGMKKKGFAMGKAVKPDFPDVDGDGDRTEPISQAQGQLQGKKGDEPKKMAAVVLTLQERRRPITKVRIAVFRLVRLLTSRSKALCIGRLILSAC